MRKQRTVFNMVAYSFIANDPQLPLHVYHALVNYTKTGVQTVSLSLNHFVTFRSLTEFHRDTFQLCVPTKVRRTSLRSTTAVGHQRFAMMKVCETILLNDTIPCIAAVGMSNASSAGPTRRQRKCSSSIYEIFFLGNLLAPKTLPDQC